MTIEFTLPRRREAREPPEVRGERRDSVRLLVSRRHSGTITHHVFTDLATVLLPGDLVVVNTSATLPAAVRASADIAVHFSTPLPDGAWMIELREVRSSGTAPYARGAAGTVIDLPGGARLTLSCRVTGRLWQAQLSTSVIPYLLRHGRPIRYSYVTRDWPLEVWTDLVISPPRGPHVADGLLTGFHEPRSSHLLMLEVFAGSQFQSRCYTAALEQGCLWHEFGDVHLLLP